MNIKRGARSRALIHVAVATLALSATACVAEGSGAPSNVLLVIADDFGLDASPGYSVGAEKPNMPTLEGLCKQGLVFDNVWAHPTCTPTRASVLTGHYGVHTNVVQVDDVLAPTPTILQAVARSAARYTTAVIGKWHVGGRRPDPNHPAQFGAQYCAGFLTGALQDYFSWSMTFNGKEQPESRYSTTVLTDHAIDWVGAQKKPWFLWLAYNAPHAPFHVPPAELHTQRGLIKGASATPRPSAQLVSWFGSRCTSSKFSRFR
jgi:arylsulfatase A-like enzyme